MATVNAGRVELDLVAVARDQVTATLREVNKSLLQTKATAEGAASGTRGFGARVEEMSKGVKEGIKPINAAREGIENLRANFLLFPAAIAGGVIAFREWVDGLFAANSATKWWAENGKEVVATAQSLAQITERLRELNNPDRGPLAGLTGPEVEAKLTKTREGVTQLVRKVEELGTLGGLARSLGVDGAAGERVADIIGAVVGKVEEAGQHQREIESAQRTINDLIKTEISYRAEVAVALRDQEEAQRKLAQAEFNRLALNAVDKGTSGAITPAELFKAMEQGAGGKMPKPPGPRQPRPGEEMGRRMADAQEGQIEALREQARKNEEKAAEESRREMAEALRLDYEARTEAAERERVRIRALADEYARFADILRDGFDAALPGLGTAVTSLGELAGQMESVDDANQRAAMGVSGSIQAVTELAAANAETAQEAFVYKGLGEAAAALGSAAVGDVKGAALHTASAVAYGVAAAAAGGGGGGGAPSAGASGASPSSLDTGGSRGSGGTSVTNVYVAPGTDPQAVARELRRTTYASRGTGRGNPGV